MSPEIRRAALRAAAKTALVVALGCGGDPKPAPQNTAPKPGSADGSATVAAPDNSGDKSKLQADAAPCVAHLDTLPTVKNVPKGDPLHGKGNVYGAFAKVEDRAAAKTQTCCAQEMTAFGSSAKHRWECCSALADLPAGASPSACTPWGPPCPPEMPA